MSNSTQTTEWITGAELHGLIMALETALKVVDHVRSDPYRNPFILIHINMDSDYIVSKSTGDWSDPKCGADILLVFASTY